MKFKNLILAASLFFVGVSSADDFLIKSTYYLSNTGTAGAESTFSGISLSDAFLYQLDRNLSLRCHTNFLSFTVVYSSPLVNTVSNLTTGAHYNISQNPLYNGLMSELKAIAQYRRSHGLTFPDVTDSYYISGPQYYFLSCNPFSYLKKLKDTLTPLQLYEFGLSLNNISADVSSLVPALESHASNVSNLAQIVSSTAFISTNLQHDIYSEVSGINYTLNAGGVGLAAINDKLSLLDPSLASAYALSLAFADVMGMSGNPHQALVSAGLATDWNDADNKISNQDWAHTVLAPAFNSQKRKNAYIQQFQKDGLTPPPGKTWDQLSENDLETIASYSYNTPVSSNATLQAHALDYLKHIKDSNASIDASVDDLRQHIQGGPLEVNVMNWPDDIFGAANISNMFNDLISNFEASLTNFNPHYTWEDALFFDRSQYSWRGLNTLDFDPRHDPNSSPIGVSTFNFAPTGNYFQDVPNFLALQSRISVDIANMIATVTAYSQTNLADRASTADLEQQYQEEFLQQSAEALNEFEQAQSYSNLFSRNARFIDTSSVFSTPSGFTEIFSGDHSIPAHINLQLPSWHFGQDDQSTPDVGSTITIETAQYATFFQNCRYVFLFLYWGITVMIMIWLFRLFTRFISWIPLSLTGGGSHDTVSI